MNLSEEQKAILAKSLLAKCAGKLVCPMCKCENSFQFYEIPGVFASVEGSHFAYVLAECKNCGLLLQFSPNKLGIV